VEDGLGDRLRPTLGGQNSDQNELKKRHDGRDGAHPAPHSGSKGAEPAEDLTA